MDPRTLYVDIDDTLICHDISEFPYEHRITFSARGRSFIAVPNVKNINLLIKFYKLGYDVYFWSKTGKSWAKEVAEKLNLTQYVTDYLTKPDFLIDDREPKDWLGPVLWRAPK